MTALSVRLPSQAYHYETRDGGPPRASSRQELSAVTLLEALDHDDRPSFAIDVETCCAHDEPLELIYCNPAFKAVDKLSPRVAGYRDVTNVFAESSQLQLAFREWVRGHVNENDPHRRGTTYMFDGYIWGAVTIGGYRIISGIPALSLWVDASGQGGKSDRILTPQEGKAPLQEESSTHSRKHRAVPSIPQLSPGNDGSLARGIADGPANHYGPFDYTREHLPATVKTSSHIKYFHNVDWATTPLGAMNTWSEDLRCMVNMVLNNKFPATLFLGDECIPLYNEPYIQLLGSFHPCMGKPIGTEAPHHWSAFQSIVDHIKATGESVAEYDMLLFIDRHGFVEETHWSFQLVPVLDSNGLVAAYYQTFYEVTDHRLLERRVSSLVAMSMQIAKAMDFQSYWDLTLGSLMLNEQDVPFALLYSAERHVSADMSAVTSPGSIPPLETCKLKGAIGVEVEHPIAPATIHINDDPYVFQSYIHQAAKSGKATIVDLKELQLPGKRLLEDIKWRGYGDPCRIVVICPILPTTGDQVGGFLILGINPRRPFDEQYQQFVQIMVRLLASSFASVALFEEEVHQRENAIVQAALIQEQLLAEIKSREKKFQRFAERSNVGIFITDPVGNYTYRNQRWYDLFEVAALDDNATTAWDRIAFPEDIPYCQSIFAKLIIEHESVLFELRTQMPWHPPDELTEPESEDTSHYKWILCSAYPELNDNGELVEIVGNVTDISKQKHAETTHRQRTDSALQGKQHLEHFIDTTSHEMRNPLSAILQCADGILTSYSYDERQPPTPSSWSSFLESTLDAAQTIVQCAQHMRHIVDDILTISKLDSGLLLITPVVAQPESIVRHVFKMYEAEAIAAGVDMSLVIDQSVRDMNVDWVSLDPTRVLQILINVITNALKFTRLETTRRVTVTFAASAVEPSTVSGGIQFNEDRLVSPDPTLENDWKQAEELFYLQFFVTDTGRGLSEEEMSSLFTRFSQASPRTHIHYGGSGLGLFISRRLTELQGGAIGLASERGKGSTFSFYIKTRRAQPTTARKGSLPTVFPEEIRHRSETPQINLPRPSTATRAPMEKKPSDRTSPSLQSQPTYVRKPSGTSPHIRPESLGLPEGPDLHDLKRTKSIPETLHVLVVEDNLVNQRVLAKQLRNLGCIVSVANHGREALDFLPKTTCWNHNHLMSSDFARKEVYHIPSTEPIPKGYNADALPIQLSLILMDWEMPIMNGLAATTKIRELEKEGLLTCRTPVIGVTANVRQQQIDEALKAGMDDVVAKPFRVAELLVRMKGIVAGTARDCGVPNEQI